MAVPTFPSLVGLSFPVLRKPTWRGIRQSAISGKDYRLQLWTYPRYQYEATFDYLGVGAAGQSQDWQTLEAFFNSVAGDALPFLWVDPYDKAVTAQGLGAGTGTQTQFNFVRALGGFAMPVQAVTSVTQVTVAGTPTTSYTLLTDPNWGLTYGLQFASAPASGAAIAWTGTYAWPCRFEDSSSGDIGTSGAKDTTLDLSNFMANFWELKKVDFATMKVL